MRKCCLLIVMLLLILTSTGCTLHRTKAIADTLKSTDLNSSFKTEPVNLLPYSKCSVPLAANVVNDEKSDQDLLIWGPNPDEYYINPKELTNHIVDYMTVALERSNVMKNQASTRKIKVSLKRMNWLAGVWAAGAFVEIQIKIPEIEYVKQFSVEENAGAFSTSSSTSPAATPYTMATAYAIHVLTWKVINDPVVKDYILCKSTPSKEKTPVGDNALDILKRRYVSGEITKGQFEQMKKDIQ